MNTPKDYEEREEAARDFTIDVCLLVTAGLTAIALVAWLI